MLERSNPGKYKRANVGSGRIDEASENVARDRDFEVQSRNMKRCGQ